MVKILFKKRRIVFCFSRIRHYIAPVLLKYW